MICRKELIRLLSVVGTLEFAAMSLYRFVCTKLYRYPEARKALMYGCGFTLFCLVLLIIQLQSLEREVETPCVHPVLEMWPPGISEYYTVPDKIECNPDKDWIVIGNGTFHISADAIKKHGDIKCDVSPYGWEDDFSVRYGETITNFKDGSPLPSDFIKVECTATDGKTYENTHSGVHNDPQVRIKAQQKHLTPNSPGMNVLMFGFDSMSRMTWIRNLPKTYEYFTKHLDGIVLEGYNIVGDGTPQALLPILTGQTEIELPEARRGKPNAKNIDGHPWIFKDFQNIGYVTQFAEDDPRTGAFTLRMLGWKNKPTDVYMRTFYHEAYKLYKNNKRFCLGSRPRHQIFMDSALHFYNMYPDLPKFSFLFHSEYSHDTMTAIANADEDAVNMLTALESKGYLDNTVLIMFADHGPRFTKLRHSVQGKYEERMPYMSFRFPTWFKKKYPEAIANLQKNVHRLTTPFDIHETVSELVNFSGTKGKNKLSQRGMNLFLEVPEERTCSQAGIEPHWCACLSWIDADPKSKEILHAAAALQNKLNQLTKDFRELCAPLEIKNITDSVVYKPNSKMLMFRKSLDKGGRFGDFSDEMEIPEKLYQLQVETNPSKARYEATIKYIIKEDRYEVDQTEISRINKYGDQPHCIAERQPYLRQFCYCKEQKSNNV